MDHVMTITANGRLYQATEDTLPQQLAKIERDRDKAPEFCRARGADREACIKRGYCNREFACND